MSWAILVGVGVAIELVTAAEKPVIARLLELYHYDMSAFRPYVLELDGTYGYRFLDAYFSGDPARSAYLVRVDGELAGFAMVRKLDEGAWEMAEFFVMRRYRRHGTGRTVAHELFRRHPGPWLVMFDDANTDARAFWPDVCAAVADVTRARKPEGSSYPGEQLRFVIR